jgi:hypothetical protein
MLAFFLLAAQAMTTQSGPTVYDSHGRPEALPLDPEEREVRVIEDNGVTRVVEEYVRRKDQNGQFSSSEKVRIEERKNPDGSTYRESMTWRGDVNGNLVLAERQRTEAAKEGATTRSTTVVERASMNGGLAPVEKTEATQTESGGKVVMQASTLRPDVNGNYQEMARQLTERTTQGKLTTEVTTLYNNTNDGMKMEAAQQIVSRERKEEDGVTVIEKDIYGAPVGKAADGKLHLREQQLIEREPLEESKKPEEQKVRERLSIRRPNLNNNQMGNFSRVAESECKGSCRW